MINKTPETLGLDVQKLIETLNCAISEEWQAFYQYWVGAQIMRGPMRKEIEKELLKHAEEEYKHAQMLIERVIQLGGTPVLSPAQWAMNSACKYDIPHDTFVVSILKQNLESERCAVKRYTDLAKFTDGKDFATCDLATRILNEELEHSNDIIDFLDDIQSMINFMKKAN